MLALGGAVPASAFAETLIVNSYGGPYEAIIEERIIKPFEEKYGKMIPLFAAGGIYTGEDISKIMSLGAAGVQMGTRFVTTDECDASMAFKQTYIDAEEKDIEIIRSPVGMPGRAILSNFITKVRDGKKQPKKCPFKCIKTCDISKSPYCIIMALISAFKGNFENGYAFAGANAFRATKITSVKELFQTLLDEYNVSTKKNQGIITQQDRDIPPIPEYRH